MRLIIPFTLFVLSLGASHLCAQTTSPAPVTPTAQNKPLPPMATSRVVKAEAVPESFKPKGQARLSTAQRQALRDDKPAPAQLPGLTLTAKDGTAVSSSTFQRKTRWILLFRGQACLPCDRLMNVLAASTSPYFKNGEPYVIVVQGTSAGSQTVRANFASLANATWLSDASAQVLTTLKPHGTPTLYGMEGDKIDWIVPGNLGDPTRVEKFVSALARRSPANHLRQSGRSVLDARCVNFPRCFGTRSKVESCR